MQLFTFLFLNTTTENVSYYPAYKHPMSISTCAYLWDLSTCITCYTKIEDDLCQEI